MSTVNPVLVEAMRGTLVESRHRGAVAVSDSAGRLVLALGDVHQPVFPRSAIKIFQAFPLVESGAADAFGFGKAELALACASHSGAAEHVRIVLAMLERAGLGESALACGGHWPLGTGAAAELTRAGQKPGPRHDNCSGKHAGMLCAACHLGLPARGYETYDHPLQAMVRETLGAFTGLVLDRAMMGIDGCSLPNYAMPPKALAMAYARLATGEGVSAGQAAIARRLIDAAQSEPVLVAGIGRFDTEMMTLLGRDLYVKAGAEGAHCAVLPALGLGIAVKCDDGAGRASEVLVAAVVEALLPRGHAAHESLAGRIGAPIISRRGERVGELRPSDGFLAALRILPNTMSGGA